MGALGKGPPQTWSWGRAGHSVITQMQADSAPVGELEGHVEHSKAGLKVPSYLLSPRVIPWVQEGG